MASIESSELIRMMRSLPAQPPSENPDEPMPEACLWQYYCELRRRGHPQANSLFLQGARALLRRRMSGAANLPVADLSEQEAALADNPFVNELWKAYKRCLQRNRPGPAAQLLQDIEAQLSPA